MVYGPKDKLAQATMLEYKEGSEKVLKALLQLQNRLLNLLCNLISSHWNHAVLFS